LPDGLEGNPGNTAGPASAAYSLPSIVPNETPGELSRQFTFPFQKTTITIAVRANASIYYGAKNGDKFSIVPENVLPESAAPGYYRAFIEDPRQDGVYTDLLHSFQSVRQEHQYTDDEYLELLTVFVQSLPYDNSSGARLDTPARFPVETLVDGTGDCDDKSLLLAGLLEREGYDTALLLFIPEHHMAVGVRDDGARYGDTGYLYVETTGVSLIGEAPANLSQSIKYVPPGASPGATPLTSVPVVIRAGTGTTAYTSAGETAFIAEQKRAVDARILLLRSQLDTFSGDNPLHYRALMADYYLYTGIHNTLVKNQRDRAGEYQYLKKIAPWYLCPGSGDTLGTGLMAVPDFSVTGSDTCKDGFPLPISRSGCCRKDGMTALPRG